MLWICTLDYINKKGDDEEMKETRIVKVKIKNALGIEALEISPGQITEITGAKGTGKTSFLDAIKMAFSNKCPRTEFVKKGEKEALLYVELDNGLTVDRRKRHEKSDYIKVNNEKSPEAFLKDLFSEEQFNPLKFIGMTVNEQNKVLLSLVEDNTTYEQMIEWFGKLPDLTILKSQHILSKLDYLGSRTSPWYVEREELNRQRRYTEATATDLMSSIPDRYDLNYWKETDLSEDYAIIEAKKQINDNIIKAEEQTEFNALSVENINNKYDIQKEKQEKYKRFELSELDEINQKNIKGVDSEIEEIKQAIQDLEIKLKSYLIEKDHLEKEALKEKKQAIENETNARLEAIEENRKRELEQQKEKLNYSRKYLKENKKIDIEIMKEKAKETENMKSLISSYERAIGYLHDAEDLRNSSFELTEKIELSRVLPGELLQKAKLPISGLILENGVVKILNSSKIYVPVDNLSEGEKLELCIDIAKAKAGILKTVLVDGFEKLDKVSREKLIKKAKESGLQYFITRVTDGELEINEY